MEQDEPHKNLLDIWHAIAAATMRLLFFEIYMLPTMDTG